MNKEGIFGEVGHLTINADTKKELVNYLKSADDKIRGLLLSCNISILILYLMIILKLIEVYSGLHGRHPIYLAVILASIYLSFGIFLWLHWKYRLYKPSLSSIIIKEYLHYKIHHCTWEIKLISTYLSTYLLIIASSCVLFWFDADHTPGILLQIIAPVGLIVFGAGLFLLLKQVFERKKLMKWIKVIDKNILGQFSKQ